MSEPMSAAQPADVSSPNAPHAAYISNPFGLVEPTLQAFSLAAWSVIKLLLLSFGVILGLAIPLIGIGLLLHDQVLALILLGAIGVAAVMAFSIYTQWMFARIILEAARGRSISLTQSRPDSWAQPLRLVWASLLAGLAIIGGFLLFIVPGIIFSLWFMFVSYVVVAEGFSGTKALRRSREIVRGRMTDVFGTVSLPSAIAIVSLVPLIGIFINIVVTIVLAPITAVRYVSLVQLKAQPAWERTPTSKLNYVVIILAVVYTLAAGYISFQDDRNRPTVDSRTQVY